VTRRPAVFALVAAAVALLGTGCGGGSTASTTPSTYVPVTEGPPAPVPPPEVTTIPVAPGTDGGPIVVGANCPPITQLNGPNDLSATVTTVGPLEAGKPATWLLTITNTTDQPIIVSYVSGQIADVVLKKDGKTVYQWGAGRSFTQDGHCELIAAHTSVQYHLIEERPMSLPAGTYDLELVFGGNPLPAQSNATVTVTS
jgi:hypothetical protein